MEEVYIDRLPNRSFGLYSSLSFDDEDNKRVCCLFNNLKEKYFENINKNKIPYLHARTDEYLPKTNPIEFTLTDITPISLQNTKRLWGLMSAIFAYLIRENETSILVYVPNNRIIGCFSTLMMIEINILRLPLKNEKLNQREKEKHNNELEKFKNKIKDLEGWEYEKAFRNKNPLISSFLLEVKPVSINEDYVSANQYDLTLKHQFYDAEKIYQNCAKKRGKNELEDDEYRR